MCLLYFQEILSFSELDDDTSTELSLDMVIFPPPKRTDVTWKVNRKTLYTKGMCHDSRDRIRKYKY
jgi:hypothetical protein